MVDGAEASVGFGSSSPVVVLSGISVGVVGPSVVVGPAVVGGRVAVVFKHCSIRSSSTVNSSPKLSTTIPDSPMHETLYNIKQ